MLAYYLHRLSYTGKLVQERRTPLEHHAAADADRLETILACTCTDRSLSTIKALKPFARGASVELLGIWSRSLEEFVYRAPLTTWVATGVIQLLSNVGGLRLMQQSTGGRLARCTEWAAIAARTCPLETPSEPATVTSECFHALRRQPSDDESTLASCMSTGWREDVEGGPKVVVAQVSASDDG